MDFLFHVLTNNGTELQSQFI